MYLQFVEQPNLSLKRTSRIPRRFDLEYGVAERLYSKYPRPEEGELTVMRARMVNRKALVTYAKKISCAIFFSSATAHHRPQKKGQTRSSPMPTRP